MERVLSRRYGLAGVDVRALQDNAFANAGQTVDFQPQGFVGGGHFGLNQAFGSLVLGLEASISVADIAAEERAAAVAVDTKIDTLALFTARAGYAFGNKLLYVRGGYALGQIDMTAIGPVASGETLETQNGYVFGSGVEVLLTRDWTAGLEYDYVNLGSGKHSSPAGNVEVDADLHSFSARLSYMFGP